jgi:hypothetical protein
MMPRVCAMKYKWCKLSDQVIWRAPNLHVGIMGHCDEPKG